MRIGKILIQRDEETHQAKLFYSKLPDGGLDASDSLTCLTFLARLQISPSAIASCSIQCSVSGALVSWDCRGVLTFAIIATGGSAVKAIEVLIDTGVPENRIVFLNLVSCPEGLKAMYEAYPNVKVVTAWIDDKLNDKKYIVPGLGGAPLLPFFKTRSSAT